MRTKREYTSRNRGMALIGALMALLLGLTGLPAFALTLYDDFNAASGVIDPTKWNDLEARTEISGGQLVSAVTGSGINTWNNQNITGNLSGQVNYIEADVILDSASDNYVTGDVTMRPFPRARVWGQFFNDGTGSSANPIGEVTAGVGIGLYRGQLKARWRVTSTVDYPPTKTSEIASGFFDLTINTGQTYKLKLQWDPATNIFTFTVGSEVHTYTYQGDQAPPVLGGKGIGTYVEIPEGSGYKGSVQARFDNVIAKDLSGSTLMTDDFSGTNLDPAKWGTFEMRRDITSGQLRLKARAPGASSTPVTLSYLTVVDPENVKTLQAKVTVASADAQMAASAQARVAGRFFNDGSPGGGYLGDIQAMAVIGMTQGSLTAGWRVIRHTDSTNSNSSTVLASGTFTTKTVSTGTPYLLYVTWDGTTFTFTIKDGDGNNPESATYTPAPPAKGPNKPFKGVYVRSAATSSNSATIEAYFDDVQVEYLAGGTISGYVKDVLTNQGINGATVTIKKSNVFVTSASTNSSGYYTATVSSDGDYTVEASATGYILISTPQLVDVYVSVPNQTANLLMYNSLGTPSLALYDNFSTPSIDKTKWSTFEFVREIVPVSQNNQLRLKLRNYAGGRLYNSLLVSSPATVTSIKADITPTTYQNLQGATAVIGLGGRFYNVGSPVGGGLTGDVQAQIAFGGSGPSMTAYCQVFTLQNSDGSSSATQFSQNFPTPSLNTTYTATVTWNSATNTFTFTLGGTTYTYADSRTRSGAHSPFAGPYALIVSGSGQDAGVEGYVDNVYVNGALYDDFSASTVIDATKWATQELVREITTDNKLRMKLRGVNTDNLDNSLFMLYPDSVNTLQAKVKVPLNGYSNANGATIGAAIHGAFYNDGTPGGGLLGDVHAMVAIGGTGTSPAGGWFVFKGTDPNDIWQYTLLAAGPFDKPISTGTEYALRLWWDGAKLTFRIADADGVSNAEEHTYTPTTAVNPPNYPWKILQVSAFTGSNKDATIEALFDDVMANSDVLQGVYLTQGWNFVSLPLQPADTTIANVLSPIAPKVVIVYGYDASQGWLKYSPSGQSNTLTTMVGGRGYWIMVNKSTFLSLTGGTPAQSIHLAQGWNLVGYRGQNGTGIASALSSLAGKWISIWSWENNEWSTKLATGTQLWAPPLDALSQWQGYWINMSSPSDW